MARIRVVCPQCKRVATPPGVPKPGDPLLCEHCGASFPIQFTSSVNATAGDAETMSSSTSNRRSMSPVTLIGGIVLVGVVLALGWVVWSKRENPVVVNREPVVDAGSKADDAKSKPPVQTDESKEKIKKQDDKRQVVKDQTEPKRTEVKADPIAIAEAPKNWAAATALLMAVSTQDGRETVKPVAMATAIGPKRFVTRALPVLATGVKNPQKDEPKLILAGAFGRRAVVKVTYHASLPITKLAEGKLEAEDYLTMMLHDAALLAVEEDAAGLESADFVKAEEQINGPASIVGLAGEAPMEGANVAFHLVSAVASSPRQRSSTSLVGIQCDATASMEGSAVFFKGRLAGLLLVNIDPAGKPTAPHSLLPVSRIQELLVQP